MSVYYVRPDGDDANSGLGPSTSEAWKTIGKAWVTANLAGDHVWIAPGFYDETLGAKSHGTASNPISYVGDPTGAIFGVNPGIVRLYQIFVSEAVSFSIQYVLLKNILLNRIYMRAYSTSYKRYALGWIKLVNVCFLQSPGFHRSQSGNLSVGRFYLYAYNCSFGGEVVDTANYGSYYYSLYFYNCAAAGSFSVPVGQGSTVELRDCIAPAGGGTDFIQADPMFVEPSLYDFRLQTGSLAIDSGFDYLGAEADPDVYGVQRLAGTIDRGASETWLEDFAFTYPAANGDTYYYASGPKVRLLCPRYVGESPLDIHFRVAAYQDSLHATLIQAWDSAVNPERFEYWNGTLWLPFPSGGLSSVYHGNEIRCHFTLPPRNIYYFQAAAYAE